MAGRTLPPNRSRTSLGTISKNIFLKTSTQFGIFTDQERENFEKMQVGGTQYN